MVFRTRRVSWRQEIVGYMLPAQSCRPEIVFQKHTLKHNRLPKISRMANFFWFGFPFVHLSRFLMELGYYVRCCNTKIRILGNPEVISSSLSWANASKPSFSMRLQCTRGGWGCEDEVLVPSIVHSNVQQVQTLRTPQSSILELWVNNGIIFIKVDAAKVKDHVELCT